MATAIRYYARLFGAALWWAFWPSLKIGTALGSGVWFILGIYLTRELLKQRGWVMTVYNPAYEPALIAIGAFFFLFLVRLLVAPYVLFRGNDRELEDAKSKIMVLEHEKDRLSDVREPKLVPHIDAFIVGEHASGKALCTLSVTIKNLGAPSVVDNYGLVIKIGDRISIGQFIVLPNQEFTVTLEMAGASASGPPLTLKQADFLYEKTTRPIATGSWERGWIMVIIPDFSREMMDVDGVIAEVSFVDVVGRRYSCDYAPTRENVGPLNYYPGAGGTHARPESQVKPETRATPKRSKKKG